MDQQQNEIYSELRKTKQELIENLEGGGKSLPIIKSYIEGELKDIEAALQKLEKGTFGTCEVSGELIPEDLLTIVPTLKSIDDCKTLQYLIRKSTQ
jgi:RNA polymerase-binding transcription factor DksA